MYRGDKNLCVYRISCTVRLWKKKNVNYFIEPVTKLSQLHLDGIRLNSGMKFFSVIYHETTRVENPKMFTVVSVLKPVCTVRSNLLYLASPRPVGVESTRRSETKGKRRRRKVWGGCENLYRDWRQIECERLFRGTFDHQVNRYGVGIVPGVLCGVVTFPGLLLYSILIYFDL